MQYRSAQNDESYALSNLRQVLQQTGRVVDAMMINQTPVYRDQLHASLVTACSLYRRAVGLEGGSK